MGMDVPFKVVMVESVEGIDGVGNPLRKVANNLLTRIRHEATSGRWKGLNPDDFDNVSFFRDVGETVGLICNGFIPQTICLNVELDRRGSVLGDCEVNYCDNLTIELGSLEAVNGFFYNSMYDHLADFLSIKQDKLNAAFGSNVWHIERYKPRSISGQGSLSLRGPKLSQDAACDAYFLLLDVMMHEPRFAPPVMLNSQAVNDYIECVDGEEKELAQAYAHYMQMRIHYELQRCGVFM